MNVTFAVLQFGMKKDQKKTKAFCNPQFSICCIKGKIELHLLKQPPELLFNLINGNDARSSHFLLNIRQHNSMFAFTSIRGKVDRSMNNGQAVNYNLSKAVRIFTRSNLCFHLKVNNQSFLNCIYMILKMRFKTE